MQPGMAISPLFYPYYKIGFPGLANDDIGICRFMHQKISEPLIKVGNRLNKSP